MKNTKIITSLLFLFFCCLSTVSAYSVASTLELFKSDEYRFSFTIPSNWKRLDNNLIPGVKALVKSSVKGASSNCNIRAELNERFNSISGKEYISMVYPNNNPDDFISGYKASGLNPELIKSKNIIIDGSEAIYIEIYITSKGHRFQTFNVQLLKNGGLYTVGCTDTLESFNASQQDFMILLNSFKVH